MPTITGTDFDDIIDNSGAFPNAEDTTIFGGSDTDPAGGLGNDTIIGGGGPTIGGTPTSVSVNDLIYGGQGLDSITSRFGADTLYGGDGDDILDNRQFVSNGDLQTFYGGTGDDEIFGYQGDDIIYGGDGNDSISSNFAQLDPTVGGDVVYGGLGNDIINTRGPDGTTSSSIGDTVYGGAGNDSIEGAQASATPANDNDFLFGGDGDDVIDGNAGTDSIDAGGGQDTVLARAGVDTTDGGTGNDVIDFSGDTDAVTSISFDMASGSTTIVDGGATVVESNVNYETVIASVSNDTILGNAADNSISGLAGTDTLSGLGGSDTFVSGLGDDSILGGEDVGNTDTDVLDYSAEGNGVTVTYTGDEAGTAQGASTGIDTFAEIERIVFTNNDDAVNANADTVGVTLATGGGADFVEAGQGDDSLDGGADIDVLSYADSTSPVTIDIAAGTASGAGTGTDSFVNFENFTLTGGNDVATGSTGAETIDGGAGNDTLDGDAGNDRLIGGDGEDRLDGGAGNDTLDAGAGNDLIFSGTGDDTVFGGGTQNGNSIPGDFDVLDITPIIPLGGSFVINRDPTDNENGTVTIFDGPNGTGNVVNTITFEEVESIVCFTRGTMIETPDGERPIEDLSVGDLVMTRDHGPQPLRWIGHRTVPAFGKLAPVVIAEGALGNAKELRVSPLHRMLITDWRAELMFGEPEVLAAAKHLVNGDTIYVAEGGTVDYVHILFDQHEIVTANGAPSESFHPGEQGMSWLEEEVREEIFTLFPELRDNVEDYGPASRMSLKSFEARALRR